MPHCFLPNPCSETQFCQFVVLSSRPRHFLADLLLGKEVGMLLEGSGGQDVLLPKIRLEVTVGVTQGVEKSFDEVTHSTRVTTSGGVGIFNPGHGQKPLSSRRRNKS